MNQRLAQGFVLLLVLSILSLPASAATRCVPLANPEPCDTLHATIQDAIDAASPGDTVLVDDGTYAESPRITTSLTLESVNGRDFTTIDLQTGPTYLGSLQVEGDVVTIAGFTIEGRDAACPTLAASNVYMLPGLTSVVIRDNRIQVGLVDGACSNGDDGIGILTTFTEVNVLDSLIVVGNIIEPLGNAATRSMAINTGVNQFLMRGNLIEGQFNGVGLIQPMSGLVEDNLIDGLNLEGTGLGPWGYPDADVWGHVSFFNNTFRNLPASAGLQIFEAHVDAQCNRFLDSGYGVRVRDGFGTVNFDPTQVFVELNDFINHSTAGLSEEAGTAGTVNGESNWWNAADGPSGIGPGSGEAVTGDVDFDPFLTEPNERACRPLHVELASFTAEYVKRGVQIEWTTATEVNTVGFRLLRETAGNGPDKTLQMVGSIIAARGAELEGSKYAVLDDAPEARRAIKYYLEDIDIYGRVTRHGPFVVDRGLRGRGHQVAKPAR